MSVELINLSNETKAHLNNLRRAIEKNAQVIERIARQGKPRFIELPTVNGSIYVRLDRIDCISDEGEDVCVTVGGDCGYRVKMPYKEVVAKVNEALGIADSERAEEAAE